MSWTQEARVEATWQGSAQDAAPAVSWLLVWCHERCHKQERFPLRAELGVAAAKAGGNLVCLKKAKQFEAWLRRGKHLPFVLMTDWREVKPCMQVWEEGGARSTPFLTLIVAEDLKLFGKVGTWAKGLQSTGIHPVQVIPGFGDTQALIGRLVCSLPQRLDAARPSPTPSYSGTLQPGGGMGSHGYAHNGLNTMARPQQCVAPQGCLPAVNHSSPGRSPHGLLGGVHAGGTSGEDKDKEGPNRPQPWTMQDHSVAALPSGSNTRALAGLPFVIIRGRSLLAPVAQMLASICPTEDPAELKLMLTAALPEQYDD